MQNEQVVLRLRIVRLHGSENRMTDVVTVIGGPFAVSLRVQDSEWAVLTLDSVMESVIFQAKFENASCLCREINGRKRIDFSPHLSMLIEGYWFDRTLDKTHLDARIPAEKVTTQLCEISYPSTNGVTTDLDVLYTPEDEPLSPTRQLTKPHLKVTPVDAVPKGPVDTALDWMSSDFLEQTPTLPINRITYHAQQHSRLKWSPDVTAMKQQSQKSTIDLESVLTSVEFSHSLDKYYIL